MWSRPSVPIFRKRWRNEAVLLVSVISVLSSLLGYIRYIRCIGWNMGYSVIGHHQYIWNINLRISQGAFSFCLLEGSEWILFHTSTKTKWPVEVHIKYPLEYRLSVEISILLNINFRRTRSTLKKIPVPSQLCNMILKGEYNPQKSCTYVSSYINRSTQVINKMSWLKGDGSQQILAHKDVQHQNS